MAHVFQASPKVNYFKFAVGVCAAVKVMMWFGNDAYLKRGVVEVA
jgi:hypothetical protein